jgi:hypothetical protein
MLEEKLSNERAARDDEILRAVEGGWRPTHIANKLLLLFGESQGISLGKIRQAVDAARARKKGND